ncbi:MAG: hypothetical protein U9N79_11540 [Actinomycetota bacterium]|nr:hypothetical protein [Actinomycetota bacterium]
MTDVDLDRMLRELSEVQDRLNALPEDAFAERYELRCRQDELRDQMTSYRIDFDAERSSGDLLSELSGLRVRLTEIEGQRIDMVSQAGGSGAMTGAMTPEEGLNRKMEEAAGAGEIRSKIGRIKGILIDRGVEIPEAQ